MEHDVDVVPVTGTGQEDGHRSQELPGQLASCVSERPVLVSSGECDTDKTPAVLLWSAHVHHHTHDTHIVLSVIVHDPFLCQHVSLKASLKALRCQ